MLARLPPTPPPPRGSAALPDLPAYLQSRGRRTPGPDRRSQADAALQAFLTAVWIGGDRVRLRPRSASPHAFAELEATAYDGCTLSRRARPGRRPGDRVRRGAARRRPRAGARRHARATRPATSAATRWRPSRVLALEGAPGDDRALEGAGRRLRRLQTALRLWDDAEPALGPTAWARTDGSAWWAVPLATGFRRPRRATACSPPRRRTPLRAFCSLVDPPHPARAASWPGRCGASSSAASARARSRRSPTGCWPAARCSPTPTSPATTGMAERIAAICAAPEDRARAERNAARRDLARARRGRRPRAGRSRDVEELIAELGGEPARDPARRALRPPRPGAAPASPTSCSSSRAATPPSRRRQAPPSRR